MRRKGSAEQAVDARQPAGRDMRLHPGALGGEGMPFPALMPEAGQADGVMRKSRRRQHMRNRHQPAGRHDIGRRRMNRQFRLQRLMAGAGEHEMRLAVCGGDAGETGGIIVAEIVEIGMAARQRFTHRGEFFRVAHAPDGGGGTHRRASRPAGLRHRLARPAGVAYRNDIRAAATGPDRAAIVETDHQIGGIDQARSTFRHGAIADDHDPPGGHQLFCPSASSFSSFLRARVNSVWH